MSESDERIARLEARLDDHLRTAANKNKENKEDHERILKELEKNSAFRMRVVYVTGSALLIIGTVAGFIIHHAGWLWDVLPMHRHTH